MSPGRIAAVVLADQACSRAEFTRWQVVLDCRAALLAEREAHDELTGIYRRMALNEITYEIARSIRTSEQTVARIIAQGGRVRSQAPQLWEAFAEGRVGAQKVSVAAGALERVKHAETVAEIDRVVVAYAVEHTASELRRWLHRLIDRLEPVDIDDAETERAKRFVQVDHGHRGMSLVTAYVPSVAAAAIRTRLRKAARAMDDERTREQRQADLFCAWLTNATGTDCDITAEVAVVVEAAALAGVTDVAGHVDDEAVVPVEWILELAESESTLWTRLLTDPAGRVLDVTHHGYQPPAALRAAIAWRDRTCRVSGCGRRAEQCDIDHVEPHGSGGPTSGSNLRTLCRRHHGMKGHRLLPDDAYLPPEIHTVRIPRVPLRCEIYFEPAA